MTSNKKLDFLKKKKKKKKKIKKLEFKSFLNLKKKKKKKKHHKFKSYHNYQKEKKISYFIHGYKTLLSMIISSIIIIIIIIIIYIYIYLIRSLLLLYYTNIDFFLDGKHWFLDCFIKSHLKNRLCWFQLAQLVKFLMIK